MKLILLFQVYFEKLFVFALAGDKASGLYGFPMAFFHHFWVVLKGVIMDFTIEFHTRDKLFKTLWASFISLIPKRKGEIGMKDYKLISLIGYV